MAAKRKTVIVAVADPQRRKPAATRGDHERAPAHDTCAKLRRLRGKVPLSIDLDALRQDRAWPLRPRDSAQL